MNHYICSARHFAIYKAKKVLKETQSCISVEYFTKKSVNMKRLPENKILLHREAEICCQFDKQIICKLPYLQRLTMTYLLLPESFQLCVTLTLMKCADYMPHSSRTIPVI